MVIRLSNRLDGDQGGSYLSERIRSGADSPAGWNAGMSGSYQHPDVTDIPQPLKHRLFWEEPSATYGPATTFLEDLGLTTSSWAGVESLEKLLLKARAHTSLC